MKSDDKSPKAARSVLITIGVIVSILIVFVFSLLSTVGIRRENLIPLLIGGIAGIAIIAFAVSIGIKLGLKLREQSKDIPQETRSFKGIRNFGVISMLFGCLLIPGNIFGLVWMCAGMGLIFIKKWGRYLFIAIAAAYTLLLMIGLLMGDITYEINRIMPVLKGHEGDVSISLLVKITILLRSLILIFCILGIYYFTRPKVKELFKEKG